MEKVLEKLNKVEEEEKIEIKNEKKYFRAFGITFWRLFAYFIIYSVLGYIIETLFGVARYGMLESRKSFLYGPFCAIYGIGAIIMVLSLQHFKKNHTTLFVGGCIVGSITEYIVSWAGETFLHLKWWDYSSRPFNINGRICLLYSFFWGALGLLLMISLNPKVDRLINTIKEKISIKALQIFVTTCLIFMFVDFVSTGFALSFFTIRTVKEHNIEVKSQSYMDTAYDKIYNNEILVKFINKFWGNEKMLRTFPRLTIQDINGNIIKVRDLYPDIKTYYYKFGEEME